MEIEVPEEAEVPEEPVKEWEDTNFNPDYESNEDISYTGTKVTETPQTKRSTRSSAKKDDLDLPVEGTPDKPAPTPVDQVVNREAETTEKEKKKKKTAGRKKILPPSDKAKEVESKFFLLSFF